MDRLDRFIRNIDNQIENNQDKNIFLDKLEIFQFTNEIVKAISGIDSINSNSRQFLIEYATYKVIEEFYRVNQYYSFDSKAINDLRKIYSDLLEIIQTKTNSIDSISKNHYEKLQQWIKESNPFAEGIYRDRPEDVPPVECSEYSPELQINILHIDIEDLMPPVLDIGCGSRGYLVNYLKNQGIVVCGIDRFRFTSSDLITVDWLEFNYGKEKWGTIISNLGFSNHFKHHNLREDGKYIDYGKTYMNILNSLKVGGSFHYAPDLPFIEKYLDNKRFSLRNYKIGEYDFRTTIIRRL